MTTNVLAITNSYPTDAMPGDTPCVRDQILDLGEQNINIEVLHIERSKKINYLKAAFQVFKLSFQPKKYDLIHAYYGHCGLVARLQFKYPVVVTYRGSDLLERQDGRIGRAVARFVDGVIVMTTEMKRVSGRADARVIPFAVNTKTFSPRPQTLARQELGLDQNSFLILFPWNPDRKEKRFDIVSKAVEMLRERYTDVELAVIFNESPETVALYMNACNALVLASDHEGAPVTVREALACTLPVVSVDVGDVRQTIEGIEGCFIARQDPQDLAEKLESVLKNPERLSKSQVQINPDEVAKQVIAVYDQVLNK